MGRGLPHNLEAWAPPCAYFGPPRHDSAAHRAPTFGQVAVLTLITTGVSACALIRPHLLVDVTILVLASGFILASAARIALIMMSGGKPCVRPNPPCWPRYSILCALHDEADIVAQLASRLAAIDYPADRLEGLLVLEAHDAATIKAAQAARKPDWLGILIVPPGTPTTKPRALNHALSVVSGDILTVYDAEDHPDPRQLREAAARFADDRTGLLACLQAPLRIRPSIGRKTRSPFVDRQFAAEYAALFETLLPGLARLGFPFPLGGTSNHFRVDILKSVGGWDAHNVTEDADLGFRLWCKGYRLGVIGTPTWEPPPGRLNTWLPQRTRWLKGYMQTLGVHTRAPWALGLKGLTSLLMTIGLGLTAAALHGPSVTWILATVLVAAAADLPPLVPVPALAAMVVGTSSAWLACAIGARRAGIAYGPTDMIAAPLYWSMLSLAFAHAGWRLITAPFVWDKTPHRADATVAERADARAPVPALDVGLSPGLSTEHVATPEPVA